MKCPMLDVEPSAHTYRNAGRRARHIVEWKWHTMSGLNVNTVRCEALFVSALQQSDSPTPAEVQQAIRRAVRDLGSRGCAARVAQEFGDHPETAVERMRWARQVVESAAETALDRPAPVRSLRCGPRPVAEPTAA